MSKVHTQVQLQVLKETSRSFKIAAASSVPKTLQLPVLLGSRWSVTNTVTSTVYSTVTS